MTSSTSPSGEDSTSTLGDGAIAERVLEALRTALDDDLLGADDDFFEAGGDSVSAVYALELLEQTAGVNLPVAVLFTHPSANGLAEAIGEGSESAA